MKWILCYGNPIDGFSFVGPFTDRDDAIAYGETEPYNGEWWWIAEMYSPETDAFDEYGEPITLVPEGPPGPESYEFGQEEYDYNMKQMGY